MEFELRQKRERKLKKQREEHDFKLKKEFERAIQDASAKLMRKRQSLREQVEQLSLTTSTDMKDILVDCWQMRTMTHRTLLVTFNNILRYCVISTYSEAVEEQDNVDVDKDNAVNAVHKYFDAKLSSMASDDACAASMFTGRYNGAMPSV